MADISNVRPNDVKDITEALEGLSCEYALLDTVMLGITSNVECVARILTRVLY
jgi:hypothetical protein